MMNDCIFADGCNFAIMQCNFSTSFSLIFRTSNGYVEYAYHQLDTWLDKDHSEIRLSTLLMYDQLFHRSHHFRTLLLTDFQNFIELTLGN